MCAEEKRHLFFVPFLLIFFLVLGSSSVFLFDGDGEVGVGDGFDVGGDGAVKHVDDAGGVGSQGRVVGDHDDSVALGVEAEKLVHDEGGRMGVQVSGWLVGENNLGVGDDGAGDSGALLLATGELEGHVVFFFFEIKTVENLRGFYKAASFVVAGVNERKGDVFDDGEVGDEIEVLEDKADFLARRRAWRRGEMREAGSSLRK